MEDPAKFFGNNKALSAAKNFYIIKFKKLEVLEEKAVSLCEQQVKITPSVFNSKKRSELTTGNLKKP